MPKVSIIVPVYNTEAYLRECLESLVNQTLKDVEIICVNDGSEDNSLKILQDYAEKDNRIIVIDKENEGQSVARNIGIKKASGEYLGFVDSDDWVDLDYFEKLYNAAKKYDCDMACAGFKRCKVNKQSVKKKYETEMICLTTNDKARLDNLPDDNYVWNKIYRRSVWLDKNIEFQAGRYFEDIALVIRILNVFGAMVVVPNVFYNYRLNPTSTVAQVSGKQRNDYNWALNIFVKYIEENNIKIDCSRILCRKEYIKFLNITLLKIYHYENLVSYKLFGFIPFLKKIIA